MAAALPNVNKWTCQFCSFENHDAGNICEICFKTKDFSPASAADWVLDDEDTSQCQQCTFANSPEAEICEMCNSPLGVFYGFERDDDEEEDELGQSLELHA